jgi:transposase
MLVEIKVLARQGKRIREIARELGVSRNTVRKYLRSPTSPQYGPRSPRPTKLAPYEAYLVGRIEAAKPDWIPAVVLYREARERGYPGGLTQLKQFVDSHEQTVIPEPLVRFETTPGQQMQVDFMTLRRGKVERFNRYLRNSFWVPLKARFNASGLLVDAESANIAVARWLREVANVRVHGDLKERPVDRFRLEQDHLLPYGGIVVALGLISRSTPTPIESLQHPLSTYDALVVER